MNEYVIEAQSINKQWFPILTICYGDVIRYKHIIRLRNFNYRITHLNRVVFSHVKH